jgi:phosphoenolpyruvate carboxylase
VILPLTESGREMVAIQESFQQLSEVAIRSFGPNGMATEGIEVIPIFESVETILNSRNILEEYISLVGAKPQYIRPFCARSDPALNSGIVPTTLAIKWALSEFGKFSEETGIPAFPIIAPGALPFRGGLTPCDAKSFLGEFPGIKTLVIQSSFRYDNPFDVARNAVDEICGHIPQTETEFLAETTEAEIRTMIPWFEKPYRQTIEALSATIGKTASLIPQRRERLQHVGLFGYSRRLGETSLPRAIGFVASCYSLGIPPELIGTGRGLKEARERGKLPLLESSYKTLRQSLLNAGRYLSKESLEVMGLDDIIQDVRLIEEYLGEELGPRTDLESQHCELVSKIVPALSNGSAPVAEIEQAAIARRSLG